ncbi:hypothetical protein H5410_056002 [Solanum commersonii]|uniref:DUF4371 domain-containing protein n=1 Tax=Solanum commersonii TaxID=4109 RepID=A0A9J5WL04_SOLCO|nr:hypothetical protein H5410_056002 [Solanum commersonii]
MQQDQSIQAAFVKLSNQTKLEHISYLKASVEVVKLLLNQELNKGNFIEILSWYARQCDKIRDLVLKKSPKINQLTSHKIQKDIITTCKLETIKAIMKYLNGDYFSLLVDESCDVSELVLLVSNILNVVGCSFKRMDELRESQAKSFQ